MLRTRLIHRPTALLAVGVLCCVWTSSASGDTVAADVQAVGVHQTAAVSDLQQCPIAVDSATTLPKPPGLPQLNFIGSIVVKVAVGGADFTRLHLLECPPPG